ncbi:hypothetical protein FRC01_012356, partial [Tulasnella sp. 417]
CGWPGILNISVDNVYNTTINRENCDLVPANGTRVICRHAWMSKDGLDPNVDHKLTVTLVGPPPANNPGGHVIAELRSISSAKRLRLTHVPELLPPRPWPPLQSDYGTATSITAVPTASSEPADGPLPELSSLHLGTGATVGIIVGIVLFFVFALIVCLVLRQRSQRRKRAHQHSGMMIGPRRMVSRPGSGDGSSHSRYPTEHLSWSPAAERLEAHQAATAAGKRSSVGSNNSRSSRTRRRMDSIPESDGEQHDIAAAAGSSRGGEKGGFSWGSPPSSPGGADRDSGRFYVSNSSPSPSPTTRLTFPSLTASGDYWSRRSSGGRFQPLPNSPLRTSLVAEDGQLRPGS